MKNPLINSERVPAKELEMIRDLVFNNTYHKFILYPGINNKYHINEVQSEANDSYCISFDGGWDFVFTAMHSTPNVMDIYIRRIVGIRRDVAVRFRVENGRASILAIELPVYLAFVQSVHNSSLITNTTKNIFTFDNVLKRFFSKYKLKRTIKKFYTEKDKMYKDAKKKLKSVKASKDIKKNK